MTVAFYVIAAILAIAGYGIGYTNGMREGIRKTCKLFALMITKQTDEDESGIHAVEVDEDGEMHDITDTDYLNTLRSYITAEKRKKEGLENGEDKSK